MRNKLQFTFGDYVAIAAIVISSVLFICKATPSLDNVITEALASMVLS